MINNWRTICTRSISNLRAHGVLFYRDSAASASDRAAPASHAVTKSSEPLRYKGSRK